MAGRGDLHDNVIFVCTKKKCFFFTLIVGLCLAVGGIIGLIVSPIATRSQVESRIPLVENSFAATQWIDPPFNITMQIWFFNTTNSDEVLRGTAKPSVTERGPYTYKQKNQKSQVVYGNNDNVSYIETNYFYFDQARSCSSCLETDTFTVPNAIYTTIAQMFRWEDESLKRGLNLALLLLGERPFVTKTVSELLFKGFEDQILIVVQALTRFVPQIKKYNLPKVFQYFPKNNTNDGRYEICVGTSDVTKMGTILSWNGQKNLTWWTTPKANEIKGTDAQVFAPYIKRDHKLPIFVSDMCRSAYLSYQADTYQDGLQTYRFTLPGEIFDSTLEENKGFCLPTDKYYPSQPADKDSCLPPGFMNLSSCRGSPMLMSMPHFLYASDEVVQSIDGVHPTSDHELIWDIQPTFGAAVNVQTKFQINVPIHKDPIFWSIKQIKPTIIPIFWFNASAIVDPGTRDYLYGNIVVMQTIGYAATFAVLLFGVLFLMIVIACYCRYRFKSNGRWSVNERNNSHVNRALIEETEEQPRGHSYGQTRKI